MVRVAAVGCGAIMHEHYRHLSALEGVELVGHCDVETERAEAAAAIYGGEVFSDFEKMYDRVKPQAVYVAVPPYARGPMEEAAARRGMHLFIEKPIALDRATARTVASAVRRANIVASVGHCFRYYDTVALAQKILKGKPVSLVTGLLNTALPDTWWWRHQDKSGGQVIDQGVQVFDLVRHLCGEVAEVYAVASTGCMNQLRDYSVQDSTVVTLRLKSGASASVGMSCVGQDSSTVALDIVTPESHLRFVDGAVIVLGDGVTTHYVPKTNVYAQQARTFIDAVRGAKRVRVRSNYADALKSLSIALAARESIASGLPVKP